MAKYFVSMVALLVSLAGVTIAPAAASASVAVNAAACTGQLRAQQAAGGSPSRARGTRRPVAMVPGLEYDSGTMTPRGICRAGPPSLGI